MHALACVNAGRPAGGHIKRTCMRLRALVCVNADGCAGGRVCRTILAAGAGTGIVPTLML